MESLGLSALIVIVFTICSVIGNPIEMPLDIQSSSNTNEQKLFISQPISDQDINREKIITNMRFKRSELDCRRLALCKMHANAGRSFFSAFELYFVNRKNANYWDHHSRSRAECNQLYEQRCNSE